MVAVTPLIDALAVYRLVRLVAQDTITQPARRALFRRLPSAKGLVTCPWCMSVWVAAGVVTARRACPRAWAPVAELLALSAAAGMIAEEVG